MLSDGDKEKAWEYNKRCVIDPMNKEVIRNLREYVVASGESHSVREFVVKAFASAGIDGMWIIDAHTNDPLTERFVYKNAEGVCILSMVLAKINPSFYRPAEVETLQGDPSLIKKELGWNPKISFGGLVEKMVKGDMK